MFDSNRRRISIVMVSSVMRCLLTLLSHNLSKAWIV
jgi:hypothetical protein